MIILYNVAPPSELSLFRDVGQRVGRRAGAASEYYWVSWQILRLSEKPLGLGQLSQANGSYCVYV